MQAHVFCILLLFLCLVCHRDNRHRKTKQIISPLYMLIHLWAVSDANGDEGWPLRLRVNMHSWESVRPSMRLLSLTKSKQ